MLRCPRQVLLCLSSRKHLALISKVRIFPVRLFFLTEKHAIPPGTSLFPTEKGVTLPGTSIFLTEKSAIPPGTGTSLFTVKKRVTDSSWLQVCNR